MTIDEFQRLIEKIYHDRDARRGRDRTFMWFVEEVGELARAMARPDDEDGRNLREEFADVFAWLVSLASIEGISLEAAALEKYGRGCPRCGGTPCGC